MVMESSHLKSMKSIDYVTDLETEFKSDFLLQPTIYKDGKPVESMTGVWVRFPSLRYQVNGLVRDVDYPELFGRGSQAR